MKGNTARARASAQPATLWQRALAALMAVVLCVGLMPSFAWADEPAKSNEGDTFSVALTIVDTTDPANGIVYNGKVDGMTAENTVKDMLTKAGFTKGTQEQSAADTTEKTYFESYGAPYFKGKAATTSETWYWWATMFNGNGTDDYAKAYLSATLEANGHYQYIYGTASTFSYDDKIVDPLASAQTSPDPTVPPAPVSVNPYDAEKAATLLDNLTERFSEGGSDAAISNITAYAALALNSMGLGGSIDKAAVIKNLENEFEGMGAGTLAKYIMILAAAGVDCTAVEIGGTSCNLLSTMESLVDLNSYYSAVWILPAYEITQYSSENTESLKEELVKNVIANMPSSESHTLSQAVMALMPYPEAKDAIDEAVEELLSRQNEDGGFAYDKGDSESNLDATAGIVTMLAALGYDAANGKQLTTKNGSTPVGYLIAQADSDLSGFNKSALSNEPMAASTVFMALAAAKGYAEAGKAFNVYDLQEIKVQAAAGSAIPQTGDDGVATAAVASAAVLGALAMAAMASRRMREAEDAAVRR